MSEAAAPATAARELKFLASRSAGEVSALLVRPEGARALYVLAHGAGAGMRHPSLEKTAARLATRSIATLRYQFPYMENRSGRPDPKPILHATVRAAVETAAAHAEGLPLIAGGRSMGGRMTSEAAADAPLAGVRRIVFLAFPLHPAGRPGTERAAHLENVTVPMRFVSGTRDDLADLDLLRPIVDSLGELATLHVVDGADHSFHVLKRSGRTDDEVLDEIVDGIAAWIASTP